MCIKKGRRKQKNIDFIHLDCAEIWIFFFFFFFVHALKLEGF